MSFYFPFFVFQKCPSARGNKKHATFVLGDGHVWIDDSCAYNSILYYGITDTEEGGSVGV